MGIVVQFCKMKKFLDLLHNVNVLNTTEPDA